MARLDFSKTHTGTETMIKFNYKLPKSAIFNPEKAQALFGTQMTSTINDIVSVIKINIQNEAPVGATSQLRNTIGSTVTPKRGVVFTGVDYAVVIEKGRKAAPVAKAANESLKKWMQTTRKGRSFLLNVRKMMMEKRKTNPSTEQVMKSALYVLKRSMKRKKREPNPFFDRGIDKSKAVIKRLSRELLKLIAAGMVK